jgi:hypothetical protein
MEENNLNIEAPEETLVVSEPEISEPEISEPVVETPEPEVKVEETPAEETPVFETYKISEAEESKDSNIISTNDLSQGSNMVQGMGSVANGVIGATKVERKTEKPAAPVKKTVAIHSTKNVSLPGVGKVYRGYNIVTQDQADKWLQRNHIRLATPEEVAKEFGR